ncbi:MAG: nonstructural protein [Microvirus sp.]|nr:MAG: nonstructural protein [Microvirus sp.]
MLYQVYTVKDKLAEEAGPPFIAVNDKVAIRQFKSMGIPLALKDEYELLKIGYFDSIDITIIPDITVNIINMEDENE